MDKKLIFKKETKKSTIYENDDYIVKIKEGGYVTKKNDMFKPWYDENREEEEWFDAPMDIMYVTSKETGITASVRCYQGNPIFDLEQDLEEKSQFKEIFKKIDKH